MPNKFNHVKSSQIDPSRDHPCHWPGCGIQIPPARFMCEAHWGRLPSRIRSEVWATYTMGQEDNVTLVSRDYTQAADAARSYALAWDATAKRKGPE